MTAVVRIAESTYRLDARVRRETRTDHLVAYAIADHWGWTILTRSPRGFQVAGQVTYGRSVIYDRAEARRQLRTIAFGWSPCHRNSPVRACKTARAG